MGNNEGFALITVLAMMVILSVIALGMLQMASSTSLYLTKYRLSVENKYLSESVVEKLQYDVLNEERERGGLRSNRSVKVFNHQFQVSMRDESALLNINRADQASLYQYFLKLGLPENESKPLAARILDWRDEDSLKRQFGAEYNDYNAANVRPRNNVFESAGELRLLMSQELYKSLKDKVTVYTFVAGGVNSGPKAATVDRSFGNYYISVSNKALELDAIFIFRGKFGQNGQLIRLQ